MCLHCGRLNIAQFYLTCELNLHAAVSAMDLFNLKKIPYGGRPVGWIKARDVPTH